VKNKFKKNFFKMYLKNNKKFKKSHTHTHTIWILGQESSSSSFGHISCRKLPKRRGLWNILHAHMEKKKEVYTKE
jgi:hypothetical protein